MNRYFSYIRRKIWRLINLFLATWYRLLKLPQRVINLLAKIILKYFPIFLVYKFEWLINKKTPTNRRYLKRKYTVESFFYELNRRNINYVVLRWFDDLPEIKPGEDIDILVADNDLLQLDLLLSYIPYAQPCDIYTVTGVNGSSYKNVPYYPPILAKNILDNRILINSKFYAPDNKRHFFSLAYHAVFHKGSSSGLENINFDYTKKSDHNYSQVLENIPGANLYLSEKIDYINLFQVLHDNGWVPEIDTFRILANYDNWIKDLIKDIQVEIDEKKGDLIVFIIRQWAIKNGYMEAIHHLLQVKYKLEIIFSKKLTEAEKKIARNYVRGGKWHRGPYPSGGGDPVYIIVCFDYVPKWGSNAKYPFVKNLNVLVKHEVRRFINDQVIYTKNANFIHSSDDYAEAVNYIKQVVPGDYATILRDLKKRQFFFSNDFNVIDTFASNNTRSKTEKIKYNGKICVKKTFKLGNDRYLNREILVSRDLKDKIKFVPQYIDSSDNYIITLYYENILNDLSHEEAMQKIKSKGQDIIDAIKSFYDNGYAIVGFYPGNIIITPDDKLIVIDFEFLHQYEVKPISFLESYDIAGVPDNFKYDHPKGTNHTYKNTWQPILGSIEQYL